MATYTHAPTGHHLRGDRILLIVLAVVAALAVAAGAALVWDWATSSDTAPADTVDTVGPTTETLDHAARMAEAGRRLNALRAVAVSTPPLAPTLAEDVATLELVVTGQLPVEAVERMPAATETSDAPTGPDLRIESDAATSQAPTGPDLRIESDAATSGAPTGPDLRIEG